MFRIETRNLSLNDSRAKWTKLDHVYTSEENASIAAAALNADPAFAAARWDFRVVEI